MLIFGRRCSTPNKDRNVDTQGHREHEITKKTNRVYHFNVWEQLSNQHEQQKVH